MKRVKRYVIQRIKDGKYQDDFGKYWKNLDKAWICHTRSDAMDFCEFEYDRVVIVYVTISLDKE